MTTPTALLVHGAWGGPGDWDLVREHLSRGDIRSRTVTLPCREPAESDFGDDVRTVEQAVAAIDGPCVLVGHSYGGMVVTAAAAANPTVSALVYVCALLPQQGDSAVSLMQSDPRPSDIFGILLAHADGVTTLDPRGGKRILYNDLSEADAAPSIAALGLHRMVTFEAAADRLGWQEHPTTYLLTTADLVLSPALQRRMSASATTVVEVDSGHMPMLSQAEAVAAAVAAAANASS